MKPIEHLITINIALDLSPAANVHKVVQRTSAKLLEHGLFGGDHAEKSLKILRDHPRAYDVYEQVVRRLA